MSRHPSFNPTRSTITLIEATCIAGGASGKAGGLLGLWAYPSSLVPLSYRLHRELADRHGGQDRWGYRAIHCGELKANGRRDESVGKNGASKEDPAASVSLQKRSKTALGLLRAAGVPGELDWVEAESVKLYEEMGDPSTTAQVHPAQFTTSMAQLAEEAGVKIILGTVTAINRNNTNDAVESIAYTEKESQRSQTIRATDIIVAAGPWTRTVLPSAPISALRAHSITIRPSRPVSAYALFTQIRLPGSEQAGTRKRRGDAVQIVTPEIYARPNNEVYACGDGDTLVPLPPTTAEVEVDDARCSAIVSAVSSISAELRDGVVTARQACYLPQVSGGAGPLIGPTGAKGLWLASGHTCWGIQNAPGTACLIAEMVWEGKAKSANIASLDPRNFLLDE